MARQRGPLPGISTLLQMQHPKPFSAFASMMKLYSLCYLCRGTASPENQQVTQALVESKVRSKPRPRNLLALQGHKKRSVSIWSSQNHRLQRTTGSPLIVKSGTLRSHAQYHAAAVTAPPKLNAFGRLQAVAHGHLSQKESLPTLQKQDNSHSEKAPAGGR